VALSVVAHLTIIGAATAATTHGPPRPREPLVPVYVTFSAPKPEPKPQQSTSRAAPAAHVATKSFVAPDVLPRIDGPVSVPTSLPEIKPAAGMSLDSLLIGRSSPGSSTGKPGLGLLGVDEQPGSGEWRGNELLMRIVSSAKPRYPEALRQTGIGGRVLVRFMVDTTGRVDAGSVRILESTHELFTHSVRESLSAFRFKPAEVGGRHVPALAEMPFEFAIMR
jgi:protein TonB